MNITFDPLDIKLLLLHVVWLVAGAAMLAAAFRAKSEWVKATLAAFGLSVIGLWTLAVLPSWWLYYADAKIKWGGQGCVAINVFAKGAQQQDAFQCFKQAAKDAIVVIENGAVLGGFVVGFLVWQKKFPKQLGPGEAKPEATGGYK